MDRFKDFIKSIRPHQWIKNAFLFAGVFFAGDFLQIDPVMRAAAGFVAFCFLASGIYLLNDIVDIEADRAHPDKRNRPIASGRISKSFAGTAMALFLLIGLTISYLLGKNFLLCGAGYVLLQFAYTFFLKRQPILDILTVASGFVIRAVAGGVAVDVPISSWLLVCTSLLALFLVTEKRRQELARIETRDLSHESRPILENYSVHFLDSLATIEISATLVAYTFYVFSPEIHARFGNQALGLSLPFVFYGLLRYLWLVNQKGKGESPTKIFLTDLPSIVNLILWSISVFLVIYLS